MGSAWACPDYSDTKKGMIYGFSLGDQPTGPADGTGRRDQADGVSP